MEETPQIEHGELEEAYLVGWGLSAIVDILVNEGGLDWESANAEAEKFRPKMEAIARQYLKYPDLREKTNQYMNTLTEEMHLIAKSMLD
ncbi:MAG: hypothetical protein A3H51_01645 [Candidatus Spechtbacteria bacterium RIFCSPLOWO2_02_FULL_38_8]|uniref:Uncharacterized protein n=1 Tax=Candidatus Spechtbacteria bacterium RIFCSPLOWO2_02_FULL_38_8 TaxID=1802164 RepID=A0A1G2HJ48_9BACT|nr:MAG: hypothetical protein A3H51_01645 [Candidatus Spechtbacteria bacterium RIFCSPLOWO2_02_FULL_38_8]